MYINKTRRNKIKNIQIKMNMKNEETKLFIIFDIEMVNQETGQVVTLTTTSASYKELGKYLTEMSKKQWKMLKVTRKEN